MRIYTSEEILAMEDLYDIQEEGTIAYRITSDEWAWVDFTYGKYATTDYIYNATKVSDNEDELICTINADYLTKVMDDDDSTVAPPMLSHDTALAKICFWLYNGE